jgi:hypothetical protein
MKGPPPGGPFVFKHHVAVKKASTLATLRVQAVWRRQNFDIDTGIR